MGANGVAFEMYFTLKSRQRVGHPAHLRSSSSSAEAAFPALKLLFQRGCQNRKALAGQAMRSSTVRHLAEGEASLPPAPAAILNCGGKLARQLMALFLLPCEAKVASDVFKLVFPPFFPSLIIHPTVYSIILGRGK